MRRFAALPPHDLVGVILAKVGALSTVKHDRLGFVQNSDLVLDETVAEINCKLRKGRFKVRECGRWINFVVLT